MGAPVEAFPWLLPVPSQRAVALEYAQPGPLKIKKIEFPIVAGEPIENP